ncbi:cobyrinate a,c-diamide synthase [Bacteroides uniformis]|jgi:cobyrinic acid a,c-diamide synthase|uniref:Cobyrinic acid a,c-diamide synthase n=1 Tax=Bacteroides uniformis TaxID=820 RepID=A0A1Y3V306_BACUN|nr:cobyrinate a,c-diamide synthase [Bacteroides uniformis]OUN55462.1 cobyrinic acid a,c-diamide synthase [Bacteroides uniformis]
MDSIPQFLIAAPTSGSGKTTVSRGLMALFVKKGLKVQPFKCGPDYIDTKYHEAVCGRPSINLDTFMASQEHVSSLYARYSADADVAVVEGMMGMYDGYDRDRGSSAEVARLLGIPVVLVADAKSAAYSMAPLLSGFINFRPDIRIAGVIFNRVGSPRHYRMLQEVCEDLNVTCLGYLPKQKELEQESRHLGLDFSRSKETEGLDMLAGLLEEHVDWELLLSTTGLPLPAAAVKEKPVLSEPGKLHVSVARNEESFSFLYAEHLDILRRMGTVTFFNPEQDRAIPQETDLLYLPGGYPENRLEELAGARLARESIRSYIEAGGRTLAECGGMIYLSQFVLSDGDTDGGSAGNCVGNIGNEMVGVLPFSITNERKRRKLTLGYRQFDYNGWRLKGHEFHYTQFAVPETDGKEGGACSLPLSIAQVYNAKGGKVTTPVFRYKNLIASYTHLYWGEVDVMALFGEL